MHHHFRVASDLPGSNEPLPVPLVDGTTAIPQRFLLNRPVLLKEKFRGWSRPDLALVGVQPVEPSGPVSKTVSVTSMQCNFF